MIRGLYSAAAGMLSSQLREGVIADNLANGGTVGYKARAATLADFGGLALQRSEPFAVTLAGVRARFAVGIGAVTSGSLVDSTAIDWRAGPLRPSNNPFAVAIAGPGFFGVKTPQGLRFTRAGDFQLNAQGDLVTPAGAPVLGTGGQPIRIPRGAAAGAATIEPTGQVRVAGAVVGRLALFRPALAALQPAGGALFALPAGTAAPTPGPGVFRPGFLEGSNVGQVGQMAALLATEQAFAADQRAVQTADHTMNLVITQVGTVV